MNALFQKLNTVCLVIIAASLATIAYRRIQPNFIETKEGRFADTRSGKFYLKAGDRLIPIEESTEEKLKREFPDGKDY